MCQVFFGLFEDDCITFKDGIKTNYALSNLDYREFEDGRFVTPRHFRPKIDELPPDEPEQWFWVGFDWTGVAVSTMGKCWYRGTIRTGTLHRGREFRVSLTIGPNDERHVPILQLVALTFLGQKEPGQIAAHRGDIFDNRLSNILYEQRKQTMARVSTKFRRPLVANSDRGEQIAFEWARDASRHFGVTEYVIQYHCNKPNSTISFEDRLWKVQYTAPSQKQPKQLAPVGRTDWRVVVGHPKFEMLPEGIIRRIGSLYLKRQTIRNEYFSISLGTKAHPVARPVHILCCYTFVGGPPGPEDEYQVNHLDQRKLNNHYTNLAWTKKNAEYSIGIPCERKRKDGTWQRFPSITEAHKQTGCNRKGIGMVLDGLCRTCGGYEWRKSDISNQVTVPS
jgi:hypothetical protein